MSVKECTNCKNTEFSTDTSQGVVYCNTCGMVQEEGVIVSSINFNSEGGVKSTLIGQMVGASSKNIGTGFVESSYYIKNTLASICTSLSLGIDHVECAYRWYKLLLQYQLSKGKSILYTLSACVYIVCRQEKTPHMLIDFSDVLHIDVFKIGKSFLKIINILDVDVPQTDPSLYMHRFVSKLKFESKDVLNLSLRLIGRMKRDWMVVGRRPNNLCGAALLVASRIVGEEKSIYEIAKTVHVCVGTINKRLREFSETESADLTVEEFSAIWIEKEEDPPVTKRSKVSNENEELAEFLPTPVDMTEDNKGDLTDEEIERNILTVEETKVREVLWDSMYGEFMKEREMRRKPLTRKVKKRKKRMDFDNITDAIKSLDSKISRKLNYQAIENLFDKI